MPQNVEISGINFDSAVPVMDREQIDMLLMVDDGEEDSTALVRELFDLFRGESAEKLQQIDAVCAANDAAELRRIVHFIAGSAGNLGLSYLCGFYRAVERALDVGTLTDLSACATPLRAAFEDACVAFRSEFGIEA